MLRLSILVTAVLSPHVSTQEAAAYKGSLPILSNATQGIPTQDLFTFEIRANGEVTRDGRPLTADGLRKELSTFAKEHQDAARVLGKFKVSAANVVARMHPDLPFEALYRVMEMCSRTDVLAPRLHLAVRAKKGGGERVFPMFLPVDGIDTPKFVANAFIRFSAPAATDKEIGKRFKGVMKIGEKTSLVFHPDSNASIASLLRAAQVARDVGLGPFLFTRSTLGYPGWDKGARSFVTLVSRVPKRPDRRPGLALSRRTETAEEVEEKPVEELEEVEEESEEREASKPGSRATGNRRRPPGKEEVPLKVAIGLSLSWLAKHQDQDGKWDADGFMKHDKGRKPPSDGKGSPAQDVGITGLALLTFLGDGNTMRVGPYKDAVKKAVIWLRKQQSPSGLFGTNATHDFIYGHAIATLAMCEAYGLSGYRQLKKNAQNGIDYLESHRNPYGLWRYQPRDNDNDVSVSSWCLMACKSATDFGLEVNPNAFKNGKAMLDMWTDPRTGQCGYTKRGEPSSRHAGGHAREFPTSKGRAMTGAALFSRFMLGQDPQRKRVMTRSADVLLGRLPTWKDDGSIDFYYWYYGTYAMYQMGGTHWDKWSKAIRPAVLGHQRKDGNFIGSWDPVSVWSEDGGRIYATAMCTLTLEATFRYRRLTKR
jgi:hypothetical protein